MTLWIILTIMTSFAAVLVSAPLMRRLDASRRPHAPEIDVYKDQLQEIDREMDNGEIGKAEADLARTEIRRRLLAVDKAGETGTAPAPGGESRGLIVTVTCIVVLGSVGLYAITGRPEVPAATARVSRNDNLPVLPDGRTPSIPPSNATTQANDQVDNLIQGLAERLKSEPDDADGWRMLGWSYFNTKRYRQAADAYGRAATLTGTSASLYSAYGEALAMAANGLVTTEAMAQFKKTLELESTDARARFFVGLAKDQAGDSRAALNDWIKLLNDAKAGDDWAPDLRSRILELAGQIGEDVTDRLPAETRTTGVEETPNVPPKGPSPEDIRNAQELAPEDRQAMIRGMVDRLAERLKASPDDPDGWIRLIRSRMVLGQPQLARQALDEAVQAFADSPEMKERVIAEAGKLGVTSK